ncbi:sarcosine oxidase subunit alpha [Povalibacter uvarum]|uniref:Sarcosine oxidase subunit alpha n=1 Tax=Povalibacter uvarum TaxID=732238 RepID=A0A841HIC9_9GAMM|nr:2Fe-2S iron-sulfur cluster-binding protein [Povalibacter uvarum]MBB6092757.1 sarcosine oxidase subunit alpha [Povalibacter uvarum]
MMYRLPQREGEWIDRTRSLAFTFEGVRYEGFAGDTITSALSAAGVMILGRSFKYHRPRGILSFANHDVNAIFQVGPVPNVRGDVTPLADGMEVLAVNTVGGLQSDRAQWIDRLGRFLPVGFYYKAFNSKRFFPRWERLIRNLSGLGQISVDAPRLQTPKRYAFCDVLVIGGGVAGEAAARAAAATGAKVMLVDESTRVSAHSADGVDVLTSSYVAGVYADRWAAVIEPHRMTKVRAGAIVFATGAIEQPIAFHNNDLPGIVMAGAAQRLLQRHSIAVGRKVLVVTTHRAGYEAAVALLDAGLSIAHIVELNSTSVAPDLSSLLIQRGVKVVVGDAPIEAERNAEGCVAAVHFAGERIDCDAVLMSGGWAAAAQLLLQAGGKTAFDDAAQMHLPSELPAGCFVSGAINGLFNAEAACMEGRTAGRAAAEFASATVPPSGSSIIARSSSPVAPSPHRRQDPRGKDFIDFDEDLQVKDIENAIHEGFDSIELLKRYTTVGMGPSQGKHSNLNAARILAGKRGLSMDQVGLTTARPMYHPVPMKHLAGRGFTPERATPIAPRHSDAGAVWMLAGNWRRPEYYMREGESREQCIAGEVAVVRNSVGLIDVGTLGKIEVHGPDAGAFLDRAYAGRYSDLKVGMTRYGLLLDEAGTIVDDGVVARLHEESFYFTTTTGGSAGVYRDLLRLNALWGLNCSLVNVTGHRAAFNLAGPRSRDLLSAMTSVNLNDGAFPYLGVREGIVGAANARLLRVGFVGELGYEIHVPHSHAQRVWDGLVEQGRKFDLRLFGVEAQRVLRLEKGHFIIGQDTDGLTNPFEAQAGWAVRMQKPFFIGQRSLRLLERRGPRQLLVGFEIENAVPALKECHLAIDNGEIAGRVTSVTYSNTLGKTIGLAMIKPSLAVLGTKLTFRVTDGSTVTATVCPTPFFDHDNQRQKFGVAA